MRFYDISVSAALIVLLTGCSSDENTTTPETTSVQSVHFELPETIEPNAVLDSEIQLIPESFVLTSNQQEVKVSLSHDVKIIGDECIFPLEITGLEDLSTDGQSNPVKIFFPIDANCKYQIYLQSEDPNVKIPFDNPYTISVGEYSPIGYGLTAPTGISFNERSGDVYAYISDAFDTFIMKCDVVSNGDFESCDKTLLETQSFSDVQFFNNTAYIADYLKHTIKYCDVEENTGALINCSYVENLPNDLEIEGITIDETSERLYFSDSEKGTIYICTINGNSKVPENCSEAYDDSDLSYFSGIKLKEFQGGTNAFISDYDQARILFCDVDQNGDFQGCTEILDNITTYTSVTFNPHTDTLFVTDFETGNGIKSCLFNNMGTLDCNEIIIDESINIRNPEAMSISLDGEYIYISDFDDDDIVKCQLDGDEISSCQNLIIE